MTLAFGISPFTKKDTQIILIMLNYCTCANCPASNSSLPFSAVLNKQIVSHSLNTHIITEANLAATEHTDMKKHTKRLLPA